VANVEQSLKKMIFAGGNEKTDAQNTGALKNHIKR
jgi:hypothetical protein